MTSLSVNQSGISRPKIIFLAFWENRLTFPAPSFQSGHVTALVKSHMNGLLLFESTIEQTTETMPPSHKTITADTMIGYDSCYTSVSFRPCNIISLSFPFIWSVVILIQYWHKAYNNTTTGWILKAASAMRKRAGCMYITLDSRASAGLMLRCVSITW